MDSDQQYQEYMYIIMQLIYIIFIQRLCENQWCHQQKNIVPVAGFVIALYTKLKH